MVLPGVIFLEVSYVTDAAQSHLHGCVPRVLEEHRNLVVAALVLVISPALKMVRPAKRGMLPSLRHQRDGRITALAKMSRACRPLPPCAGIRSDKGSYVTLPC